MMALEYFSDTHAGLFAGANFGLIENCKSSGAPGVYMLEVFSNSGYRPSNTEAVYAGGIAGYNAVGGMIIDCKNKGDFLIYVKNSNGFVPDGIAGFDEGDVINPQNEGIVHISAR